MNLLSEPPFGTLLCDLGYPKGSTLEAAGTLLHTHFWRPFWEGFGAGTPPKKGCRRLGRGDLGGCGNIAFGPLKVENALCFWTFWKDASAKPQRDITKVTYLKFLLQRPREVAVKKLSFLWRDRAEVVAKKL